MPFTLREKHFKILEQTTKGLTLSPLNPVARGKSNVFFNLSKIPSHQEPCPRCPARWCLAWLEGHGTESRGRRPAQWWYWLQLTLPVIAVCSRGLPSHFTRASSPWIHSQSTSTDRNEEAGKREGRFISTHHSKGHFLGRRLTSCTFPPQFLSFMPCALDVWSWSQLCYCVGEYMWELRVEQGSMEGCHQFSPSSPLYPSKELHPGTFRSLTLEWEMTLARVPRNTIKS